MPVSIEFELEQTFTVLRDEKPVTMVTAINFGKNKFCILTMKHLIVVVCMFIINFSSFFLNFYFTAAGSFAVPVQDRRVPGL